jgi:hypothetical protein
MYINPLNISFTASGILALLQVAFPTSESNFASCVSAIYSIREVIHYSSAIQNGSLRVRP